MYFTLRVGVLFLSLFCFALLCVHSSSAIILKRTRKLIAVTCDTGFICNVNSPLATDDVKLCLRSAVVPPANTHVFTWLLHIPM